MVEQREREAAVVITRQARRGQADVVLLGVAGQEELAALGGERVERTARSAAPSSRRSETSARKASCSTLPAAATTTLPAP